MYRSLEKNGFLLSLIIGIIWLIASLCLSLYQPSSAVFSNSLVLELILFHLCIFFLSWGLNKLLIFEKVISVHNYVPFILSLAAFSALEYEKSALRTVILATVFLLILKRIMSLFNKQEGALGTFEIGVLTGLVFLTDTGLFYILLGAFIAVMQSKTVSWRDVSACIMGFCFPIALNLCWNFFVDAPLQIAVPSFHLDRSFLAFEPGNVSSWAVYGLGLMMLIAFNHFRSVGDQLNIKQRVHFKSWIYGAILFLLGTFLTQNAINCQQIVVLTFVFLSPCLQLYLSSLKRAFWKNLLFLICLICCLILRLG